MQHTQWAWMQEEVQYLAGVPGGAPAMLVTQAHVVLCFAVAAVRCFLEVRKGCHVVPTLHVLCPCKKAQGINTASSVNFPTSLVRYPEAPSFLFCARYFACMYFHPLNISLICHRHLWVLPSCTPSFSWEQHPNFPLGTALPLVLSINVPLLFPTNETLSQEYESWSGCNRRENSSYRLFWWQRSADTDALLLPPRSLELLWFLSFLILWQESIDPNRFLLCLG